MRLPEARGRRIQSRCSASECHGSDRGGGMRIAKWGLAGLLTLMALGAFAQDCPLEGSGTVNDPKQNVLKNRVTAPGAFEEMTVTQFKKEFKPNLGLPTRRANFADEQIDLVSP